MNYHFLLDLGLILLSTKVLGVILKKLGLPQVLGALIAGVILGVTGLVKTSDSLTVFSQIGVILIMFTAGMETNFKELKKNGVASVVITSLGVIVPFLFGFAVAFMIPDISMKERMFFGVILTATSVGITVATLRELDALHGKVGSSVVTAAILDDIIGIIILAFFTANASEKTAGGKLISAFGADIVELNGLVVFLNVLFFFMAAIGLGLIVHYFFKFMSKKYPHTRRLSIFSLAMCFIYAWAAEELFGIAAITGAFVAGMMIANMKQTEYVERRVEISAYMLFSPIFFAGIGIGLPYDKLVSNFSGQLVAFSIVFIIVGLLGKFLGCGLGSLSCKYKLNESMKVGVSMMVRGEVCLIVAQAGVNAGIMSEEYFPAIVGLIIVSSLLTPIFLKLLFRKYPNELGNTDGDDKIPNVEIAMAKGGMEENAENPIEEKITRRTEDEKYDV